MTDLYGILDASREATARSLRAEAAAEKALAATEARREAFDMVRGLIALIADPKSCGARFHELDDRLAKATSAEAKLAKDLAAHRETVERERKELDAERGKLADLLMKYKIERAGWDAGHYRRVAEAEENARSRNGSDIQPGSTLTRDSRWADGETRT